MKRLRDIGEDELIGRLVALVPRDPAPAAGPGDDCAVIDEGGEFLRLLKTDALVEGVHFTMEAEPRAVGWKALARVVSDFAAMGGRPEHFLATLALPPEREVGWVEEVYRGMADCMERWGGFLAGGETSRVPEGSAAVISIAGTGRVARTGAVLRSGGRPGDAVLVTGELGGSIRGKHLAFTPRVEEGEWLARHFRPGAMMDLSDGLAKDLPRLAAASGCGFRIDRAAVPATAGCSTREALGDGEDFELLLAVGPDQVAGLLAAWRERFPELRLTVVGELVAEGEGSAMEGGWDHFGEVPSDQ